MINVSRLTNGMRVLTERIPHSLSVSTGIWILRGSRNELEESSGVTHFVEHMCFKGTEKRTALDISREIESVGGTLNAFTGKELTCLYARVLHEHLPLALDLLSDMLLHSTYPEEEIEKERQVILQEINMIEDSPEEFVHELFSGAYWRGHPLGRSTLGTTDIVDNLDRTNLTDYAACLRNPSRVILTVAGHTKHEDVMALAEKYFLMPSTVTEDLSQDEPQPHAGLNLHRKELEQVHICLGTPGYAFSHPRRYAYHVLNTLLGGGMSSRLFQEIRENRGLAYSVYSFQSAYVDSGLLGIYVGSSPENLYQVIDLLVNILSELKQKEVSREDLSIAKEQLKGNLLLSTESTSNRMSKLAMNEIYFGKQLEIEDAIKRIDKVTAKDVMEISEDLFQNEHLHITILGDAESEALSEVRLDL